jgi:hypothetical protein
MLKLYIIFYIWEIYKQINLLHRESLEISIKFLSQLNFRFILASLHF